MPHAGDRMRLKLDAIDAHDKPLTFGVGKAPRFAGIDVGKVKHVVIGELDGDHLDWVWAEATSDWGRVRNLLKASGATFIIDGVPETTEAQRLCAELRNGAYVDAWNVRQTKYGEAEFVDHDLKYDAKYIKVNREVVVDQFCDSFNAQRSRLMAKKHRVRKEIENHFKKLVKGKDGRYLHGVVNHYGFAGALALQAALHAVGMRLSSGLRTFRAADCYIENSGFRSEPL